MMGYAQIIGSFTLDGSLVNQAPFEDVKRRGALGGQSGGGVVGLESIKEKVVYSAHSDGVILGNLWEGS